MKKLKQLQDEARDDFEKFDNSLLSNGTIANIEICLNKSQLEALKDFIDSLVTKAYEKGRKDLIEEIEKELSWAMEKKLTIRLEEIKEILNQFK